MPHKPNLPRRISHSTPPSTKGYHSRHYDSDSDSDRDDYPRRRGSADDIDPSRYSRGRRRDRGEERGRSVDYSDNDTDYDPLDKYYLSGDEKRHDRRQHQEKQKQRQPRGRSLNNPRRRGSNRVQPHSRPSSTSSASSRSSSSSRSPSPDRGRKHHPLRNRLSRTFSRRRHHSPSSISSRSSSPSRSPSRTRRLKDKLQHRARSEHPSSLSSRSSRDNQSKSHHPKSPEPRTPADIIFTAARTALEAGAVAALKLRDDPSPFLGAKGSKIATAAIAAAVVDTFIDKKYPKRKGGLRHTVMRQATQMAIGDLVMPAVQGKKLGGGKGSRLKGPLMGGATRRR